jgi:hypothetical protein
VPNSVDSNSKKKEEGQKALDLGIPRLIAAGYEFD